jgi:hypothetical protein
MADAEAEVEEDLRKVPCCLECNTILGNKLILSIGERRNHVRQKLRKKYKKFLFMPRWDEDELAELDSDLAEHIRRASNFSEHLKKRLSWR